MLRARDLADTYRSPDKQLRRLADRGYVRSLAHGYWILLPLEAWGQDGWRPTIEAAAAGIAAADYGTDQVAVMGVSAARVLGALPRAHGVGVVAAPRQRRALTTTAGTVVFVTRDITALEVERHDLELGPVWVTGREQTLLDITGRPTLGEFPVEELSGVQRSLAAGADWERLRELARAQRRPGAFNRALALAGPDEVDPMFPRSSRTAH